MKIDIIIAYMQRYEFGHERDFVPPITGIHLAAITPEEHKVRVIHQQIDQIDYYTDADLWLFRFSVVLPTRPMNWPCIFEKKGK